jgi:hypothetical protein
MKNKIKRLKNYCLIEVITKEGLSVICLNLFKLDSDLTVIQHKQFLINFKAHVQAWPRSDGKVSKDIQYKRKMKNKIKRLKIFDETF